MARLEKGFLVTPVDVFCESAKLLDFLLCQPEISQYQIDSLWDLLLIDIMKWGTNVTDHNKRMIAGTVFHVVRATLIQYYDTCYSEKICDLLNHTLEREQKECDKQELAQFFQRLMDQSPELCKWINKYDETDEWLSEQIANTIEDESGTTAKKKRTAKKEGSGQACRRKVIVSKPKTLKYYKHGNKSLLMKQQERVDIVFKKFGEWGWIDGSTTADDFDSFFEGEPRHCNINWTGSNTILTILLQELLKQPYIEKQTGCAAKSLVEQQFGRTANSDRTRLDGDAEEKIELILLILDIKNPLPERRRCSGSDETDIQDAALREIFSGQLRSTKGI